MKSSPTAVAAQSEEAEAGSELRNRVQATMLSRNLSQKSVAGEVGLSPAALSQWLNGKYPGDVREVEAKVERWYASLTERLEMQALTPAAPQYFASKTAEDLLDAMRHAQGLEDLVLAVGVPGIGKTTACRRYRQEYPNVWVATMASHTTGVVPALREIADAVGAGRGSGASGLARAIVRRIEGTYGLLIIDEAHHLSVPALDAIRAIYDDAGIGVALVGSVELAAKLSQRMPQLYSRIGRTLFRQRVLKADVAALLDAWNVSGARERALLAKLAQRPGALRSVTKVLRLATATARSNGGAVTLGHLEDASETLSARSTREEEHA